MISVRRGAERFTVERDWGTTRLTFLPDDSLWSSFRCLHVLNEDVVAPGKGFGMHPHRHYEILCYMLAGTLEHRDDAGHVQRLGPGDLQHMTTGSGLWHSETNPSTSEPHHYLQLWIEPDAEGLAPRFAYAAAGGAANVLRLLASRDGRDGSLRVHQDLGVYAARLDAGAELRHPLRPGRHAWVQVASGRLHLAGEILYAGDGAGIGGETEVRLAAAAPSHVLLLDLA